MCLSIRSRVLHFNNSDTPDVLAIRFLWVVSTLIIFSTLLPAQTYDLLLKQGHVYDHKNNRDGIFDVGIKDGKIAVVAPDVPVSTARKVVNVEGLWVSPGFIDLHTHVFVGPEVGKFANGINSLSPDNFTLKSGVTTVVDAGTSGWQNFESFKAQVIDHSLTRVLSFVNIAGPGMCGKPLQESMTEMQPEEISKLKEVYPNEIVGVKIGHFEKDSWRPFELALQAAENASLPLFVECHLPHYSLQDQLSKLRPGDIITHSFEQVSEREPVIDESGKVRDFVLDAYDRGVLFDVGHGGAGFWFSQAVPAFQQGLWPNSFGTDMHKFSVNAGMKDMLNVMSKYMAIGMKIRDVLARATWLPAQAIHRHDLGHLSVGAIADIAVVRVREGQFGFVDAAGFRLDGTRRLEAELTVRAGRIVWDLNGLAATPFRTP